ncbi:MULTISPECIES: hypothetical protein [unclassified Nostoc]|uniref:hypothetical protein n=1 Tax=unclassified Nostoc TaxID=2593658 RepID=UPI002AD55CF6|nr:MULTISPECIES: hypothetical protein [unclassified Nostoc]MDZ8125680.1 hypothetical protein [Nostoc sp. CmiVER01]MDZ8228002.1 hypothetical protein [Nostoc sp. ChiVER01]
MNNFELILGTEQTLIQRISGLQDALYETLRERGLANATLSLAGSEQTLIVQH